MSIGVFPSSSVSVSFINVLFHCRHFIPLWWGRKLNYEWSFPPYFFLGKLEVYRTVYFCVGFTSFCKVESSYQVEEFSKLSSWPLKFRIMLSINRDHFTFFFYLYSFSFFLLPISLVKIWNTILSKSGKCGEPYLIFNFRGFNVILAIGLWYKAFIMLSMFLLFVVYSGIPLWKDMDFFKGLFCIYGWPCDFCPCITYWLYYICICICWTIFACLEWKQFGHGSWYMIVLICSWIWFEKILLRNFVSMFISEFGL